MLVGRADEEGVLRALVAGARDGTSSALIVHGDPGVGKTALVESLLRDTDHMTVVRTRPFETESELPFAGLSDLLRPFLGLLEQIPERQAAVLSGAFALGPPAPGDRFAAAAATLSLLAAAAEDGPLLVLVDDAHWLDAASREALLFAGRRLGPEGIALLFATDHRPWIDQAGIATLELKGLAPEAARELIDGAERSVVAHVRDRIVVETRGNPLAMLEAVAVLTDAQLQGLEPLEGPIPVGPTLERALARRLEPLPQSTRLALLVAAASDTGDADEIVRAMRGLGLDAEALIPAEDEGLIARDDGRVEFRHPLVRSAAYHSQTASQRRTAHRSLAEALDPSHADRIAWHLAATCAGPDERVASLLEASGERARAQGGYASAGRAFETAAQLSRGAEDRVRRSTSAGHAYWLGGRPQHAADVVAAVLDLAPDPVVRADMQSLRGAALMFCQPVQDTYELMIDEARRAEPHDVVRAVSLLMQADMACMMSGQLANAIEVARWADRLAEPLGEQFATQSAALVAFVVLMSGRQNGSGPSGQDETEALLGSLSRIVESMDPLDPAGVMFLTAAAQRFAWLDEWSTARTTLERVVDASRRMSVLGNLSLTLAALSELELRQGRVPAAYAAATESAQLARDTGQVVDASYSLVVLARVQAIMGLHEECRANVAAALDVSRRYGADSIEHYSASVLGLLELSLNRPERAIAHLDECAQHRENFGCELPTIIPWQGDAIEAMIRVGRREDALRELERLERSGRDAGLRSVATVSARCRGLLADEDDYEARFAEALDLGHDLSPLERARTELCLGMRRRRSRHRSGSRAAFRSALSTFESLGAEPWAEQARAGLRSVGGRPTGSPGGTLRELTPQELQVALIVAEGASNKDAAAALFLSPKTIEFHLGNVYRKLGLRSRTELVRRIASADTREPDPQTQQSRGARGRP